MFPSASSGFVRDVCDIGGMNCNSLAFVHAELCDWSVLDSSFEKVSTAGPHVSRSAKFRKSMAQTCSEDNQNWRCSCWVELLVFRNALKWVKGRKHLPKVFVVFVRIPACHVSLPLKCWLKTIWLFLTGHLFKWQAELDLLVTPFVPRLTTCEIWAHKLLQVPVHSRLKRSTGQVDLYYLCRKPRSSCYGSGYFACNHETHEFLTDAETALIDLSAKHWCLPTFQHAMSACHSNIFWRLFGRSWRVTCSNGKLNSIFLDRDGLL